MLSIVDGLDTIHNLSIVLQDNLNGCKLEKEIGDIINYFSFLVPLKDVFKNFSFITNKLMRNYNFPNSTIQLLGQARLFKDPIVSFFINFTSEIR